MDLVAVPTGVNHRAAAYAHAEGSPLDKRDFYIGAALIKHPRGDHLVDLVDSGFGRDLARQFAAVPRVLQKMTTYEISSASPT